MEQILMIIALVCFFGIAYYANKTNELEDKIKRKEGIIKLYEYKVNEYEEKIREQEKEIHELWNERLQYKMKNQQ